MGTENGGPAFPVPMVPCDNQGGYTDARYGGMSLRDYFACQCRDDWDVRFASIFSARWSAWLCYQRADHMLEARK